MEHDQWTPEQEAAAMAFCRTFEGTPHQQRRLKAGRGADCVRFAVGVLQAAKMVPDFDWPSYPQDIGHAQPTNWLAGAFQKTTHCHTITPGDWIPQSGDVGIFKTGPISNHIGVMAGGRFWHVTATRPVHQTDPEAIRRSLQEIIRIHTPGLTSQIDKIIAR